MTSFLEKPKLPIWLLTARLNKSTLFVTADLQKFLKFLSPTNLYLLVDAGSTCRRRRQRRLLLHQLSTRADTHARPRPAQGQPVRGVLISKRGPAAAVCARQAS